MGDHILFDRTSLLVRLRAIDFSTLDFFRTGLANTQRLLTGKFKGRIEIIMHKLPAKDIEPLIKLEKSDFRSLLMFSSILYAKSPRQPNDPCHFLVFFFIFFFCCLSPRSFDL